MKFTYLRNVCKYNLHYLQRYNKVLIFFNNVLFLFVCELKYIFIA